MFVGIARFSVRFRWLIVAVWIAGTVISARALPSLGSQVDNNNSAFLPRSAPSQQAARLAQPLIGPVNHSQITVVAVTSGTSLSSNDQAAMEQAAVQLQKVPTVPDGGVRFLGLSPNHRAVQILVTSTTPPFSVGQDKTLIDNLHGALHKVSYPPGLQVHLAGQVATNVANQQQSNRQGNQVQLASILLIIVLLLIIFRSVLAPLLTLLPAVLVLVLSSFLIGGLASAGALKISFFTQVLLIVLLLGAGTDYGLFLVFRVREELLAGREPHDAVVRSVQRVGESIAASAATVIVALLTLILADFGLYHDLGLPLALGIAVMVLSGLTLLPALLSIFGRAVFWPSKTLPRPHAEGTWGRIAGRLIRRPAITLSIGVVVLGIFALLALGFKPGGFGGEVNAPAGSDAAKGNAAVAQNFPQSNRNPTFVVMRFPRSVWQDTNQLEVATRGLTNTRSFTTITGPLNPSGQELTTQELSALYNELHRYGSAQQLVTKAPVPPAGSGISTDDYDTYLSTARYISADGETVQWQTGLRAGSPDSTSALHAVPGIRTQVTAVAKSSGATANGIAGEAPAIYDVSHISGQDVSRIVPIAILAIGIVLALVLRSLVAPLYLILSVLLSYFASLGLAVLIFMNIGGEGGITFLLPFLMFIFLLALGEDYNILVMTRIREEARRPPLRQAVVRAIGATGPTVTSAGLVLAGTFAVLAIVGGSQQGSSQVRAIGVGLAVGILLDTFVVRTVLVPSTVELLGRWNWWPASLDRRRSARSTGSAAPDQSGSAPRDQRQ